jgi:hypothetical protein
MSMMNSNNTNGNRTRPLPVCSAVPQPTAPLRPLVLNVLDQYSSSSVVQQPNSGLGRLIFEFSRSHTIRHTLGRTPLDEWSAWRTGRYLHNTQHSEETNIHALSGIQPGDPSNLATIDRSLRPHGHRDRQSTIDNRKLEIWWQILRPF